MSLSEHDLREMVRQAIARQSPPEPSQPTVAPPETHVHASHIRFALLGGGDSEGRCLIEPSVGCNHCGYCQSMGH